MIASRLLFGGALLQLATLGMGGNVAKCVDQAKCLDVTVTKLDDNPCSLTGSCFYKACIKYNNDDDCPKEGAISHRCDKSDASMCPNSATMVPLADGPEWDTDEAGVPVNDIQCQIGAAGTTLEFIYKDGSTCDTPVSGFAVTSLGGAAAVTCRPTRGSEDTPVSPQV